MLNKILIVFSFLIFCTVNIKGNLQLDQFKYIDVQKAPYFFNQPSAYLHFLNSTGALIDCEANGQPRPKITWLINRNIQKPAHDIENVRKTFSNGSLWLQPFSTDFYKQEVHSTIYTCLAENEIGAVLSRDISVTAVIDQQYEIQVYDEFVLMGNTAVLRCHIPSFLKEHLNVIGWIRSVENQNSSNSANKKLLRNKNGLVLKKYTKNYVFNNESGIHQHIFSDIALQGRYSVFSTGELHIRNSTPADSTSGYRCIMNNQLTGQRRLSSPGRLIVTESTGTVPPRITHSPPLHIYARVGQPLEIPCAAQSYPLPSYLWTGPLKNEELFKLSYSNLSASMNRKNFTFVKPIQLSGSLYFGLIQIYHQGSYECTVKNSAGEEKVQVNLHVLDSLKVIIEPKISKKQLKEQVLFNCFIEGRSNVNLSWFKNGRKLEFSNRIFLSSNNSQLIINNIQREDAGLYQCFANSEFGSDQANAQLELGYSHPVLHKKFESTNFDKKKSLNQRIVLRCETSGNPLPKINWLLDKQSVFSTPNLIDLTFVNLIEHVDTSPPVTRLVSELNIFLNKTLKLENLSGLYSCVAINPLGSIEHSARINIHGTIGTRKIPSQKLISGMTLTLNCPYTGYPIDNINWYKGSEKLPVNRRQFVFSNGTLIVSNAQKGTDDGQYECKVNQAQLQKNQSIIVIIKKGPVLEEFNFPRNLELGMRAKLVCTVITGDPPFIFTWSHNGKKIFDSFENKEKKNKETLLNEIAFKVDEFSADLSFKSVTEQHNGDYSCKVSNDVASIEHKAQLKVNVPPYWKVEPRDVNVLVGMRARLDCLAFGHPKPIISWEKDIAIQVNGSVSNPNTQLNGIRTLDDEKHQLLPNGSLLIQWTQKSDAGLFFCSANNGIGPGLSKMILLTVHSAPQFAINFKTETVRINEPITFDCVVSGDKPIRSWWKNSNNHLIFENQDSLITSFDVFEKVNRKFNSKLKDQIISSTLNTTKRIQILSKLRHFLNEDQWLVSSLIISNSQPQDSGHYICTVENEFGSADLTIRLVVEEPPHKPKDIKLIDYSSRTAQLSWSTPFNGNSEIIKYWVACHLQLLSGNDTGINATVLSFNGNLNSALIKGLRPSQSYYCSIRAENEIGLSESSENIKLFTKQEAPEGQVVNLELEAIDSRTLKVKWFAPDSLTHNGPLKGFYIGYKIKSSVDQMLYKTLELLEHSDNSKKNDFSNEFSILLNNLKPFTEYSITVQCFNNLGAGPSSLPTFIRTLEEAPSGSPKQIKCFGQSSQSLLLSWRPVDEFSINGVLLGYRIQLRPLGADFKNMVNCNVSATDSEKLISSLNKFTNYSIQVFSVNSKGESPGSRPIYCRTMEDVPSAPAFVRTLITGPDGALVTWTDPIETNGVLIKYTVYWRELQNNRTKTSITIPRSIRTSSSLLPGTGNSLVSGNSNVGAKYFYFLKNGIRRKYRKFPDVQLQYKLSALKENVEYQLWLTASTRKGEGASSDLIYFKPAKINQPKILEFSQSLPFLESTYVSNFSKTSYNSSKDQTASYTNQQLPVLLTCTVFSTDRVERKWTYSNNQTTNPIILDHEPDGSLLINEISLDEFPINYTCSVFNSIGSDQVIYSFIKKNHQKYSIEVQVLSTLYDSAQILFKTTIKTNSLDNKDYEVHYRNVNNEYSINMVPEYSEWTILPIFLPPIVSNDQRSLVLGNQSETVQIQGLECGGTYELFVKQPSNGWQSKIVTFRTHGQAPIAPRKTDVLQVVNKTLYIKLDAWFFENQIPKFVNTPSSLAFSSYYFDKNNHYINKRNSFSFNSQEIDSSEKNISLKFKNHQIGCPIKRFLCEYRTSNTGLWKLLNIQQVSSSINNVEFNLLNDKVIYTIRITAFTVGKPFTVVEYDVRINEQGSVDYDEFALSDNDDSVSTVLNINSKTMMLDQHTIFSIICSIAVLALGCLLLMWVLLQRRRGLLMRTTAHSDKNIYRKVINNGDNSSTLLQSTIAYNRSVAAFAAAAASAIRQPSALLVNNTQLNLSTSKTTINTSSSLTNSNTTYVAAAAAAAAVAAAVGNVNSCTTSPRINCASYSQCNKKHQQLQPPPPPCIQPPSSLSSSIKSKQISIYPKSTLSNNNCNVVPNKSFLNNSFKKKDAYEEIAPYATFTLSPEDVLDQAEENSKNNINNGQMPKHVRELHQMHRQLSKIKHQQTNFSKNSKDLSNLTASVVDIFKHGQSTTQQFLKQNNSNCYDKKFSSLKRENSSSNNLDNLEKKLLEEDDGDQRIFTCKIGEPGYVYRYCLEGNQLNNSTNEDQINQRQNILTHPSSYLNTVKNSFSNLNNDGKIFNQNENSQKLINQINQLQKNSTNEDFNQFYQTNFLNTVRAETQADSSCSAIYEFSCMFNKKEFDESCKNNSYENHILEKKNFQDKYEEKKLKNQNEMNFRKNIFQESSDEEIGLNSLISETNHSLMYNSSNANSQNSSTYEETSLASLTNRSLTPTNNKISLDLNEDSILQFKCKSLGNVNSIITNYDLKKFNCDKEKKLDDEIENNFINNFEDCKTEKNFELNNLFLDSTFKNTSKKSMWSNMQTILISEQKSASKKNLKKDDLNSNKLFSKQQNKDNLKHDYGIGFSKKNFKNTKQFMNYGNQDLDKQTKKKDYNRPPIRIKSKKDEIEC